MSNCSWVYAAYSEVFEQLEFFTKRLELCKTLARLEQEAANVATELNNQRGTTKYDCPPITYRAFGGFGGDDLSQIAEHELINTQKYIENVVRPALIKILQSKPGLIPDESASSKELFVQADKISWEAENEKETA